MAAKALSAYSTNRPPNRTGRNRRGDVQPDRGAPGADGLGLVEHVRSITSESVSESEAVESTNAVDDQSSLSTAACRRPVTNPNYPSPKDRIVDITRRQLGRLAAVGTGALLLPGLLPASRAAAAVPPAGTWGDQGDGTYVNPIIPADLSDWDCIRVGNDYYGITSTFGYSPGMAVLHSKDLVNWRTLGGAVDDVTRIGPELNWDRMNRYGRGVWAGAIRHHAGRYWIYFNTPDEGFFMTSAPSPTGPWEPLHALWRTSGWNDVCPFWDDDGQGYLVTTQLRRRLQGEPVQAVRGREVVGRFAHGHPPVAGQRGQQAVQDRRSLLPPLQRGEARGPGAHDEPRHQPQRTPRVTG